MFDLDCGVRLRAFRSPPDETDLDGILSLYNDTRVAPLISELFVIPRGQKLKDEFKELIEKNAEMFCVIETIPSSPSELTPASVQLPQFIGITGLWGRLERGHRHVNYSIVLVPEFWNKGLGTAITKFMVDHAFHALNMHRVSLEVYEGNDRATAVYRKYGFVDEGRQRQARWVNGGWKDIIHMGILVDEWKELRKENQ